MSLEPLALKEAFGAIRRFLPEIVYLFDSFLRRKAQKFRAISQHGTLFRRVMLTVALALTCGFASYALYRLDPLDGLEGIMGPSQRAFWTALVPMIAVLLTYWLVRRPFPESILVTFLNLGLVTCTALVVIPGVLSLAGANASALASDIREFRAGHGAGTPVREIVCTTLKERAEINAMMRRLTSLAVLLNQNTQSLAENSQATIYNTRQLQRNAQRLIAIRTQFEQAGDPRLADPALHEEFGNTMRSGLGIIERGTAIFRQGLVLQAQSRALNRENLTIISQSLALEYRQTTAMYRLMGAYPVATAFLVIAIIAGLLMWLFAGVIAWKLVVTPQPTRKRRVFAGTSVVGVFLVLTIGMSVLRSGLLEIFVQEPPTRAMLEAQLRTQFEAAAPICGRLDNHGLW